MRRSGILTLLLLLASCASAPKTYDFDPTAQYSAPFDRTWDSVIQIFAERNWPISTLEKDSGIIVTDWVGFSEQEEVADCGTPGGLSHIGDRRMRFNVYVQRQDNGGSHLRVNTRTEAYICTGSNCGNWYACNSTGKLEGMITAMVSRRLR